MATTESDVMSPAPTAGRPALSGPLSFLAEERDRLAGLRWQGFEAEQISPTVGAEISGVSLREPLDDTVIDDLHIVRGECDKAHPRCEVEVRVV